MWNPLLYFHIYIYIYKTVTELHSRTTEYLYKINKLNANTNRMQLQLEHLKTHRNNGNHGQNYPHRTMHGNPE